MKYKDIPEYLKNSEFYKSLADDDSEIEVTCKENTQIKNKEDLVLLIKTLDFWDCKIIPYDLFKYIKENAGEFNEVISQVKVEARVIEGAFN